MNLLLLDATEIDENGVCVIHDDRSRHLLDVLGVKVGGHVRTGIICGPVGTGTVQSIDGNSVTLRWSPQGQALEQPPVDLLLALPRPKVLKRLWAQLAALRVRRIVLTNAAKVERYYFDTHVLKPDIYRPLLLEGLAQGQHTWLPEVSVHRELKPLVEDQLESFFGEAGRVLAEPSPICDLPDRIREGRHQRVVLAVGPEGGWTPYELELFDANGFQRASLGPLTLRSDTACIALLAVTSACLESA